MMPVESRTIRPSDGVRDLEIRTDDVQQVHEDIPGRVRELMADFSCSDDALEVKAVFFESRLGIQRFAS
jgi:hypothetical protein